MTHIKTAKEVIINAIQEKKGFDILIIDLQGVNSAISDYFILCSAASDRQSRAIAFNIEQKMKKLLQERPMGIEGYTAGKWILMDYGDIIVHVFYTRTREFYDLEGLWGDCPMERIKDEAIISS